jgi:hypothetical protein
VVAGAVAVGLGRVKPFVAAVRSRAALVGGRVILGGAGIAALPGAIAAFAEIV